MAGNMKVSEKEPMMVISRSGQWDSAGLDEKCSQLTVTEDLGRRP